MRRTCCALVIEEALDSAVPEAKCYRMGREAATLQSFRARRRVIVVGLCRCDSQLGCCGLAGGLCPLPVRADRAVAGVQERAGTVVEP